jgi:hypothetical protein
MLEYEEKNRVGWEKLFQQYLSNDEMEDENNPAINKMRKVSEHFLLSLAIES